MAENFPGSLDTGTSLVNSRETDDPIPPSDHNDVVNALIAAETKLGYGASTPSTTGNVLTVTGSGQSAWQAPTNANLAPQASQTANFTAAAGNYYPVNATSAAVTVTLPSSTSTSQPISIEKTDSSTNAVTITGTIDGSSSTIKLVLAKDGKTLIPDASGGWIANSTNLSLSSLDSHYLSVYNVKQYGATGNLKNVSDGVTTASSPTFTSATAGFTSADTGKYIEIPGAGASGATLSTTITYVNATTVTLATNATTAVTGASFWYGTDDTAAIQEAVTACLGTNTGATAASGPGGTIFAPAGKYLVSSRIHFLGSGFKFCGAGQGATYFRLANQANQEVFLVGNGNSNDSGSGDSGTVINCNDAWFMDFTVDGNRLNQTASSLYGSSATRNLIRWRSDNQNSYGGGAIRVHVMHGKQNGLSCESHAMGGFYFCFAEDMAQNGMWAENGSQWDISHCYTRTNGQEYATSGGVGIKMNLFGGGMITSNQCKGDLGGGISVTNFGNGTISSNSVYRPGWEGATTNAATGIYALGNNIVIDGNTVYGSYGHGMSFDSLTYSVISNNSFERNGQAANNTYSDIYITFAGASSCYHNTFIGNTFQNDTSSPYYANAVGWNINSNSATAHYNNQFIGNQLGTPVTATVANMFNGNYYSPNHLGVNPVVVYNYGYLYGTGTLNPAVGSILTATGYNSTSAMTVTAGSYVGQEFTFIYSQDSGNKQLTWDTTVVWPNSVAPVFNGKPSSSDVLRFIWDGTVWHGTTTNYNSYYSFGYVSNPWALTPDTATVQEGTGYYGTSAVTIASGRYTGQQFTVIFNQDVGNKALSWPSNVIWPGNVPPVLSTIPYSRDVMTFTWDGSYWNGSISAKAGNQTITGDITVNSLPTAAGPTVVVNGTTGTTTYAYEIVAYDTDGDGIPSAAASVTTGNATLTSGNYNAVSWNSVPGATGYKVLRNVSGAGYQLLTTITSPGTTSLQDNGTYTATSYTASTVNPGGNATIGGKLNITAGTGKSVGTGTLTAGSATITNGLVTANSLIFLQNTNSSTTNVGTLTVSAKTAGTSFTVTSTNASDTSPFSWWIVN